MDFILEDTPEKNNRIFDRHDIFNIFEFGLYFCQKYIFIR